MDANYSMNETCSFPRQLDFSKVLNRLSSRTWSTNIPVINDFVATLEDINKAQLYVRHVDLGFFE